MEIHVVGGCYPEMCHWPNIDEVHGSGGRAAEVIAQLSQEKGTYLHTVLEPKLETRLSNNFTLLECDIDLIPAEVTPTFEYDHPLSRPRIHPDLDKLNKQNKIEIKLNKDNVVIFGMLEATTHVKAKRIVYDPQNVQYPLLFSETKNKTEELALVLNQTEANILHKKIDNSTGTIDIKIEDLADNILSHESANIIVIKCGQRGAYVKEVSNPGLWVSAYKTENIFPIGSGDCFVAAFSYYWMLKGLSAHQSAKRASAVTAFYCENRTYPDANNVEQLLTSYIPLNCQDNTEKSVYMAGPFFNLKEIWLVNQARQALINSGVNVFSPYHNIGPGTADEVVQHDIHAIENSHALYALFDGGDPGTLFEIGYAIKCGKPVVIYAENASNEQLKMYEGTGCTICRDFSTSIYKLCWSLSD